MSKQVLTNKVPIAQYKNLKPGTKYVFKTYNVNGHQIRDGLLIKVATRWDERVDDKGKITKRTLVGDYLQFEPLGKDAWLDFDGERLKIFSTTVYRGLFEIFGAEKE